MLIQQSTVLVFFFMCDRQNRSYLLTQSLQLSWTSQVKRQTLNSSWQIHQQLECQSFLNVKGKTEQSFWVFKGIFQLTSVAEVSKTTNVMDYTVQSTLKTCVGYTPFSQQALHNIKIFELSISITMASFHSPNSKKVGALYWLHVFAKNCSLL